MFIVVDNFDSFVYNIVRYFEELDEEVIVFRNNDLSLEMVERINPYGIIISPGPGTPLDSGISMQIINHFKEKIPILGICLGHQAIASSFGGQITEGKQPVHGKVFSINHDQKGIFEGIRTPLNVTRYHSLIVDDNLPDELEVTARSSDGVIMGIRHKKYKIEGVQFHPEAHLTECGHDLLRNFIKICK
ncbi:aminodeoxychorismate synthase, glutamine amidotransferase subunit [Desulfonispora thiosulfatigenes DSM 11270]|uniref:Aminodeoxychorismate synthase, glutamine amidotransferase subunit n=1 Tax=Desulfonispora thiosulfatigenes DSM 11270 TaxID=656914 RepID=A0A1W1VSL9_DESTI|nr:aminodeoxychorismate/anthranilate synthase component II [Desulfonispora thiosulfatigenes]SMB96339.1 aminodeoxychorismate synthase, glutamine amidotransferase subunit [Desulfonispora thiosulfatigenes DSM 11270]